MPREGKGFAMKRKRFSVEQIVTVLRQVELGMKVADATRQIGVSEQTFKTLILVSAKTPSD